MDTTEQLTHFPLGDQLLRDGPRVPGASSTLRPPPHRAFLLGTECPQPPASATSAADVAPARGLSAAPLTAWLASPDHWQRGSSVAGCGQKGPLKAGTLSLVARSGSGLWSFAP